MRLFFASFLFCLGFSSVGFGQETMIDSVFRLQKNNKEKSLEDYDREFMFSELVNDKGLCFKGEVQNAVNDLKKVFHLGGWHGELAIMGVRYLIEDGTVINEWTGRNEGEHQVPDYSKFVSYSSTEAFAQDIRDGAYFYLDKLFDTLSNVDHSRVQLSFDEVLVSRNPRYKVISLGESKVWKMVEDASQQGMMVGVIENSDAETLTELIWLPKCRSL